MKLVKDIIKKVLYSLGYEIRRIPSQTTMENHPGAFAQGVPVFSAIDHNTQQRTNEYYANEEAVKLYLSPERLQFYNDVIQLAAEHIRNIVVQNKQASIHIGDVGCGPGDLLASLANAFPSENCTLVGLDFSEAAIRVATRRFPHINFRVFDVYRDFEQYRLSFDVLFCTEVLEHLLYPAKALSHLLSMTKNVLVLTVPDGRKDTFAGHINFWSPESWEVFISENVKKYYPSAQIQLGRLEQGVNYAIIDLKENEK